MMILKCWNESKWECGIVVVKKCYFPFLRDKRILWHTTENKKKCSQNDKKHDSIIKIGNEIKFLRHSQNFFFREKIEEENKEKINEKKVLWNHYYLLSS